MRESKPLYRKVNRTAHGASRPGGDYKRRGRAEAQSGSMHAGRRMGLDYRPLFHFLVSKVGGDWGAIYSEAKRRLDRPEPIFWQVALTEADRRDIVLLGESSHFSGLYVDENNRLAKVAPELRAEDMTPSCPCCTHTFNGAPFGRKFDGY